MTSDHLSATLVRGNRCVQRVAAGQGLTEPREVPLPHPHVRIQAVGGARMFAGLKRITKQVVRLLYVLPLLLVVKLVLLFAGVWWGDFITVGFVTLVVLLFSLIALLLLLYPLVGPPSRRRRRVRLDLGSASRRDRVLQALGSPSLVSLPADPHRIADPGDEPADERTGERALLARGRLCLGTGCEKGDLVLQEHWLEGGDLVARLVRGRVFALLAPDRPPVVVVLHGPPLLVTSYADPDPGSPPSDDDGVPPDLDRWLRQESHGEVSLQGMARGRVALLAHGDEVELVAPQHEVMPDAASIVVMGRPLHLPPAADTSPAGPYRSEGSAPWIKVVCTPDRPVLLRRL